MSTEHDPGLVAREDQVRPFFRSMSDEIGFHYRNLKRWGMEDNAAATLTMHYQTHLIEQLDKTASEQRFVMMLRERAEAKTAEKENQ